MASKNVDEYFEEELVSSDFEDSGSSDWEPYKIHDERNLIFKEYWKLGNLSRQREFISRHITDINPKHRYPKQNSNRPLNYRYSFNINGLLVQVCKTNFKNTLNITDRTIRTVRSKLQNGFLSEDLRGKHKNHKAIDSLIKDSVCNHIKLSDH
ncbi:hypothetical protein QTP88_010894 [Uroleucon formosanum]